MSNELKNTRMDHAGEQYEPERRVAERRASATSAPGVGPWEKSFADLCAAAPERSGTTADERDARWVALLDAANAYLLTDAANGFMVVLQDKKTWFGLGTKAQFSIMLDGRSGLQLEQAEVTRPAPAGNSSGAPSAEEIGDSQELHEILADMANAVGLSPGDYLRHRKNLVKFIAALAAPSPTGESPSMAQLIRAYNSGYMSGHQDTVESQYTDIDQRDMSTYHADVVADMIADGTLAAPAAPAPGLTVETLAQHVKDWFPDRSYQAQFFAEAVMKGEPHHSVRHLSGATPARKEGE